MTWRYARARPFDHIFFTSPFGPGSTDQGPWGNASEARAPLSAVDLTFVANRVAVSDASVVVARNATLLARVVAFGLARLDIVVVITADETAGDRERGAQRKSSE
jgi:hypothetical protein